jgi:uncharacterized protein (DUF1330 family)
MAKGYWVSAFHTISDPQKLAAYNKLAGPASRAGGGRPLALGGRVVAHDAGIAERTVRRHGRQRSRVRPVDHSGNDRRLSRPAAGQNP